MFTQKELSIRRRRCHEFFKDYYISVLFPLEKAKVVADSLSHIIMSSLSNLDEAKKDLAREV